MHAPIVQEVCRDLLNDSGTPKLLFDWALDTATLDAPRELVPDTPAADLLRKLIEIVLTDPDPKRVDMAAVRLYHANIQGKSMNGKYTQFFFPQIIEVLEQRERTDLARGQGSIVTRTLKNLELVGCRRLADRKEHPVVVRHIP